MSWKAPEYTLRSKGPDWFIAVTLIASAGAISAIIYDNFVFAALIVVGTFSLITFAMRVPPQRTFSITSRGIMIDTIRHPYDALDSFWIADDAHGEHRVIIQTHGLGFRHITLPVADQDPDEIRHYLLQYLPEEEAHEPLGHRIMEYLGF